MTEKYLLPSGYKQVEYIESSGTQYIDTGLKGNLNTELEGVFAITTFNAQNLANIAGDNTTQTSAINFNFGTGTGSATIHFGNKSSAGIREDFSVNTKYKAITNKTALTTYESDGTVRNVRPFGTTTEFTTTNTMSIFKATNSTVIGSVRFYSFKIRDNGVLVRNFVPCIDPNNVVGMYDVVNGVFYNNDGTGVFTAGPDITLKKRIVMTKDSKVPDEYQELTYINNGTGGYIITDIYPTGNDKAYFKASATSLSTSGNTPMFGNYHNTSTTADFVFYVGKQGGKFYYWQNGTQRNFTTDSVANKVFEALADYKNGVFSITVEGNTETQTQTHNTFTCANKLPIGARYTTSYGSVQQYDIYEYKHWRNDVLIADLVPAKRLSDNEVGMYDVVSKTFYTNQGTGTFTAGQSIPNIFKTRLVFMPKETVLPSAYQKVEYIESSGNQWINTRVNTSQFTNAIVYGSCDIINRAFMGVGESQTSTDRFLLCTAPSGTPRATCRLDGTIKYSTTLCTSKTKMEIDLTKQQLVVNDTEVVSISYSSALSTKDIYLFGANYSNGGTPALPLTGKIYETIFNNKNTPVAHFIPCIRKSDSIAGMYDTANSGKNLFDKSNSTMALLNVRVENDGKLYSAAGSNTILVPVKPNTTYTVQYDTRGYSGSVPVGRYNYYTEYPVVGETVGTVAGSVTNKTDSINTKTFTTNSDTKYVAIWAARSSNIVQQIWDTAMVEEGSTATAYEPYPFYTNAGTYSFTTGAFVDLPSEYQEVEYLESSGTQYIDTGLIGGSNSKVEVKAYSTNTSSNYVLIGARNSGDYTNSFTVWQNANNKIRFDYSADTSETKTTIAWDTSVSHILTKDAEKNYVDGVSVTNNSVKTFDCNYSFYLFGVNSGGSFGTNTAFTGKIYYCKIWDDGILVRNFIPAIRKSDNVAGMYDLVSKTFFTNSGTGTFSTGSEVHKGLRLVIMEGA